MTTLRCITLSKDRDGLYEALYRRATPDRKQRADRYLRREDGLRCLAAGELLRQTVERELGITDFAVVRGPDGKPRIAGQERFHFNLSHSGSRVAIAWGRQSGGFGCGADGKRKGISGKAAFHQRGTILHIGTACAVNGPVLSGLDRERELSEIPGNRSETEP